MQCAFTLLCPSSGRGRDKGAAELPRLLSVLQCWTPSDLPWEDLKTRLNVEEGIADSS